MNKELSRLEKVELNDVWENEPQHFTPWLAEEENLTFLGETLGMALEVEGVEISGEGFRADILCKNEDGSRVLIENQLHETDHKHLGQILTYVAGLNAQTVIWIAKKFCNEHRAALDKLNEMTADKGFQFFGIEIKVWQIGDSDRAPQFEVVSSPNDWSRTVIQDSEREIISDLSEIQLLYKKFWSEFGKHLIEKNSMLRKPKPQPIARMVFGVGKSGFGIYAILSTKNKQIRIQFTIRGHNTKAYFHLLQEQRKEINSAFGENLEWAERPELEESQVYLVKDNTDLTDESDWKNQHEWLTSKLELFDNIFRSRIKALNVADWEPPENEDDQ